MKKQLYLLLAGLITASLFLTTSTAYAGGGLPTPEVSASPSSLVADGSSKTTLTVFVGYYKCDGDTTSYYSRSEAPCSNPTTDPRPGSPVGITASGNGNSLSGGNEGTNGARYADTGSDGNVSFYLSSSVAESKTITVRWYENDAMFGPTATTTVTFTTPVVSKPVTTKPKTTTPTPAPEPTPPEAPKPNTIEVGGQPITTTENIPVGPDEPFMLGGKTVPNGIVKLYIFSTPRETTVTADANGDWTYEVTGLEPGAHHIEAEVTDPATNKTSSRATLASFTVAKASAKVATTAAQTTAAKKTSVWIWVGMAALVLGAVAVAVWWFWWRKRQTLTSTSATAAPLATPSNDPTEDKIDTNPPSNS